MQHLYFLKQIIKTHEIDMAQHNDKHNHVIILLMGGLHVLSFYQHSIHSLQHAIPWSCSSITKNTKRKPEENSVIDYHNMIQVVTKQNLKKGKPAASGRTHTHTHCKDWNLY